VTVYAIAKCDEELLVVVETLKGKTHREVHRDDLDRAGADPRQPRKHTRDAH
jgi:hypothetical protein